ncbi:hypothetical protein [Paenibacillus sp. FSL K6-2524]|uniref:hypothetical protein n=1 Tax=Paenibacillus sp. FSL K6-2524 TaxID=2954516 RepID=UPI0030FC6FF8
MIKMNLLENGVDSLKSAYMIMEEIPNLQSGIDHKLKDAVFSLNHGIEILLKLILKDKNEYLIFSDLDKYMLAKRKMIVEGETNVFEVNSKLKTVSLIESISRIKYLCNLTIEPKLEASIEYLNKIRNEFMHYEIKLEDEEMLKLLDKLRVGYELSIQFFGLHIEDLEAKIAEARYQVTVDDYMSDMAETYGMMRYEEERELRDYEDDEDS